ncbi:KH domain-containing protein HEN4 [Tripterygium wilfordii]|uniref:KH domain-containing protein HEN4 n=1 Tax=Tripterygium wilfordii TaxID=458696 RepID=UPI0018F7E749|nr:KH domain-containing protein HEN4 [Tripterygium wilfordii]
MGSTYLSPPAKRAMPDPNSYSVSDGSSTFNKRTKPASRSLMVPQGHVLLRLLSHASRVGGVIGKSGNVIKQLQQTTGAKIRIEEAPQECPDRVISIVADSTLSTKLTLNSVDEIIDYSNGSGEDGVVEVEVEVSSAQEALVRVFDRILEVAAETDGAGMSMGIVSCRLLAEACQVGSVIGKGGKVVEKIRKDCGCKIRVFTDNMPTCAGPADEVIEIEGDVLAVKRGLVAVSSRLQDCQPADKKKVTGSKPLETVLRETLPDLHPDRLSNRNSMLPTMPSSTISYASRAHSLAVESDRITTLETKAQQKEVTFKILCSNDRVGGIIGKGGTIIKALQSETGASISIGPTMANCDERLITVTANENPELRYSSAQRAVVLIFSTSMEAGSDKMQDSSSSKGSPINARVVVPSSLVGCLLGKGGTIISEMRKVTGAGIKILGHGQVPKCAADGDQVVQISGEFLKVRDALYQVTGRLRDNLFSSTLSVAGTRSSSSVLSETSPYGRLGDHSPVGLHSLVGASYSVSQHASLSRSLDSPPPGLHRSAGVSHYHSLHTPLQRSVDNFSHSSDCPPSQRLWPSQKIGGVNARGMTDVGRGLTSFKGGLALGRGSKSAIVTNTTVEIIVPNDVIGAVYGENGTNLARLREISGAKVIVHEPRLGSTDRIIVISGTPNQTQAAQSLLQAFILTGSS